MKGFKKWALAAAAGLTALFLTGCGGGNSVSAEHTYSI